LERISKNFEGNKNLRYTEMSRWDFYEFETKTQRKKCGKRSGKTVRNSIQIGKTTFSGEPHSC